MAQFQGLLLEYFYISKTIINTELPFVNIYLLNLMQMLPIVNFNHLRNVIACHVNRVVKCVLLCVSLSCYIYTRLFYSVTGSQLSFIPVTFLNEINKIILC